MADQRQAEHYRADIDGLRAIAVLSVVAYHLGGGAAPGGYVGVDIFFVISGYLIGGIVLRDIQRGAYTAAGFYLRRIRRIAPALLTMLAAITALVWIVEFPKATVEYGKSLIAAVLSVSNLYFQIQDNYFDASSREMPLLHTWSLSVEEQFYLIFPIIAWLVGRRSPKTTSVLLWGLTIASFAVTIVGMQLAPTRTFFLLPTRFWELSIGVVATLARPALLSRRWTRELAAIVGLALIGGAIFAYASSTAYPGWSALAPCAGTAFLLVAGAQGETTAKRLLSFRPLVFFGLISYSLYLWHWPLIVLAKAWFEEVNLSARQGLVLFGLATGLAWLSWRFVERPWRNRTVSGRKVVLAGAVGGLTLGLAGAGLVLTHGAPARFSPRVLHLSRLTGDISSIDLRNGRCFISSANVLANFDRQECLRADPARPDVLVLGDSHAAQLWPGLTRRQPGFNFMQATASGCLPILRPRPREAPVCRQLMRYVFDDFLTKHSVDWVLVAANWEKGDLRDAGAMLDALRARGIRVILAGPVVRYNVSLPDAMAMSIRRNSSTLVDHARRADGPSLDADYRALAKAHGAIYFSPYEAMCPAGVCQTLGPDGDPLQFDYGHLTGEGSLQAAAGLPVEAMAREPRP